MKGTHPMYALVVTAPDGGQVAYGPFGPKAIGWHMFDATEAWPDAHCYALVLFSRATLTRDLADGAT